MKVEICYEPSVDREWDEFVALNGGCVFHLSAWSKAFHEAYGYEPLYMKFYDGELLAVLPLFLLNTIYGKVITIPFVDYAGFLFKSGLPMNTRRHVISVAAEVLKRLMASAGADYVELKVLGRGLHHALESQGFREDVRYNFVTFVLNLKKGLKKLSSRIHPSTRRAIRRASEAGIKVLNSGGKGLRPFYELYLRGMKYHGVPPHSFDFFRTLWKYLRDHIAIYLAYKEGIPVAAMWFYVFNRRMHYAYGAHLREYGKLQPMSLILWTALNDGFRKGVYFLDLGRTRAGSGVFEFKRKWGGTVEEIGIYVLSKRPPFLDPLNPKLGIFSRLWRALVPVPLTAKVGRLFRRSLGR